MKSAGVKVLIFFCIAYYLHTLRDSVSPVWVIMCKKISDRIHVIFSLSLWLQCALLRLPGSLDLDCSWTAPQCESPQVISLAKSKYYYIFKQIFLKNFKCHISSIVRVFDLILKLRARPKYQLYSGTKYINVILSYSLYASHQHYLDIETT